MAPRMLPSRSGPEPVTGSGPVTGPARVSVKASTFIESVIRDMTWLAVAHDAVDLAQGFPDFSCPVELKDAAKAAIDAARSTSTSSTSALDPAGDDVAFARHLVSEIGVACVPGSSCFADPADARHIVGFAFPKRQETLLEAASRLRKLS